MVNQDLGRPSWEEFYMFSAFEAATRSSCLDVKTGAVIVKDKRIIASGYSGAPPGIKTCIERGCRKKELGIEFNEKGSGQCRGAHAEINAMSQLPRGELKGTTMYSVYFPCSACAKAIVGNGISELVFAKIYKEPDSLTKELFSEGGVKLRQLKIDLDKQFARIKKIAGESKEVN